MMDALIDDMVQVTQLSGKEVDLKPLIPTATIGKNNDSLTSSERLKDLISRFFTINENTPEFGEVYSQMMYVLKQHEGALRIQGRQLQTKTTKIVTMAPTDIGVRARALERARIRLDAKQAAFDQIAKEESIESNLYKKSIQRPTRCN